jgi:hypothetical protein
MVRTLTDVNAVIMISIVGVFPAPVQIQGFAADDIFSTDPLNSAELSMGVDGKLSAGFVFVQSTFGISLQSDSPSCDFFDFWYDFQQSQRELFPAFGQVVLPSIGRKWLMNKGFLTTYPPIPDGGKILKPRKFVITWESVLPSPI